MLNAGRITGYTDANGTATFTYDANDNVLTASDSSGTITREYDALNKVTKYVYGLGLIGEDNLTTFKTYHFDLRGSTVAITNTKGAVIDTFKYDTYGKVIKRTGTTNTPFQYNGRDGVMTDENGLLYMRSRYYSPELKRFLNADIVKGDVSHSATLNQYAYVNGNPISYVDPFGTSADQGSGTQNYEKVIDYLQTALDIIGFIPGYGDIADLINALIYAVRGDWANAGLSALAIIPMLGSLGTGTKLGGKAFGKVDDVWAFFRKFGKSDEAVDLIKTGVRVIETPYGKYYRYIHCFLNCCQDLNLHISNIE
ncbi:MAG: RHS repeat-associated core domain-containing protein [Oscillospiraceae bacterium]